MLRSARNLKAKGDHASRIGKFNSALPKLEAALKKAEKVDARGRYSDDIIISVQSRLAAVSLKLGFCQDAHRWADAVIEKEQLWLYRHGDERHCDYRELYLVEAVRLAYFTKAILFEKSDKIDAAVEYMSIAQSIDEGCGTTYYRLVALKKVQEERLRSRAKVERRARTRAKQDKRERHKLAGMRRQKKRLEGLDS